MLWDWSTQPTLIYIAIDEHRRSEYPFVLVEVSSAMLDEPSGVWR